MERSIRIAEDLWVLVEAAAARSGRRPEEVVADAVRRHLEQPADVLDRLAPATDLTDDEAMDIAVREVKAHRSRGRG